MADTTDPNLETEGADNRNDEGRPAWLPDNFNSPEDLAKSYQEAQRKITELGQQNKGLEESIGELTAQWDQYIAEQARPDPQNAAEQLAAQYGVEHVGYVNLAAQIAQQTAQQILQQTQNQQQPQNDPNMVAEIAAANVASRHDDWSDYVDDVKTIIQTEPMFQAVDWLNLPSTVQALDSAYRMAKADKVLSGEHAERQRQADARQMKLAAQTAVGATGRPELSQDAAEKRWEEIMNAKTGRLQL